MPERPHVLHVLEALEGGTSRHLVDVVRHAVATRHSVVVPARRSGGLTDARAIEHLVEAGAEVHLIDMRRRPWTAANLAAVFRLWRLAGRIRPDIVHGHSSIGGVVARLGAARLARPVLYTPNGITQVRGGLVVERWLRRRTTTLIAVSPSEAELATRLGLIPSARVVVIPNGIDPAGPADSMDLRAHLGIDPGAPLVGTIARLVPQKAPLQFVALAERVAATDPTACFVLIGSGELGDRVDSAAAAAGLGGRFFRVPALPEAAGVLAQLDVFALTSRFEGGPYAPLEAMRAATPVVVTDVVGSRDAVEHGVSGLVVPPDDPDAISAAVTALLGDPVRRRALGEAGRSRVAERFDVRTMGEALDRLYRSLAGRPSSIGR